MILVTELGASLRHYLLWGAECAGHGRGMSGKSSGSHRLCPCSLIRWLLAQSLERCKPSDFVEGSMCQRENMRKCSIGGTSMIDTGLVSGTSNSPWWRLCLPWLFGLRADVHLANYHVTPTARLNVDLWRCIKMITRWLDDTRMLKVVPAQIQPPASQRSGEIRNEVQWFIESLSIYSQIQIISGIETVKRGKRYQKGEKKRIRPWRFHLLFRRLQNSIFGRPGWCPQLLRDQGRFMPTNCRTSRSTSVSVWCRGTSCTNPMRGSNLVGVAQMCGDPSVPTARRGLWNKIRTHTQFKQTSKNVAILYLFFMKSYILKSCVLKGIQRLKDSVFSSNLQDPFATQSKHPRCRTVGGLWCGSCVGVRCVKLSGSVVGFGASWEKIC